MTKEIFAWSRGEDKVLNIIAVPYSRCDIFEDIIFRYIKEDRKILYIVNDEDGAREVTDMLKINNIRHYFLILNKGRQAGDEEKLVIATYEGALVPLQGFDLVIYDDLLSLSKYSKYEILDLLSTYYKTSKKIICRSIEAIFHNALSMEIPLGEKGGPLVEPRIITTRLDLTKEIPNVIYDYLKWSIYAERNVVIYTPGEEIAERVYEYLSIIKENLLTNILLYNDSREREVKYFLEKRKGIIVTDKLDIVKMMVSTTDFIVYLAEDRVFEYKRLVYICSKVSNGEQESPGEVIFLSNEASRDMENCKDIIRGFNKQLWDMGLAKV
jgi:Superfamily II DNA/RNA helicase required for DNA uptake (late competence protein)